MCMSCGCGEPDADHGDPRHITRAKYDQAGGEISKLSQQQMQDAADAAEISVDEVRSNIEAMAK